MELFAPAKLNLYLRVGNVLPDGYHEVETVMQTVSWGDTVSIEPHETVIITCTNPAVPTDERNLCMRAVHLLKHHSGYDGGVSIAIEKNIPVSSGLGGGASNVAAVLRGMNELFRMRLSSMELLELAGQIGTDVPGILLGGTVLGTHHGEMVSRLPDIPPSWFVIVDTECPVSTKDAYAMVAADQSLRTCHYEPSVDGLKKNTFNTFTELMAGQYPAISETLTSLKKHGAYAVSLTGTGGAVFGIFSSRSHADSAAAHFPNAHVATSYYHPSPPR